MFNGVQVELVASARKSVNGTTRVRQVPLDVLILQVAIPVNVMLITLVSTVSSPSIRPALHPGGAHQSVDLAIARRTEDSIQVATKQLVNATVG